MNWAPSAQFRSRCSLQLLVASCWLPQSIAVRAELARYTLTRALITKGNAALTLGCILAALTGLLRRSRPFSCEALLKIGVKRPALSWGRGGDASPHISVYFVCSVVSNCPSVEGLKSL